MPANTLPSGIGDLFQLAERVQCGLAVHGLWLFKGLITEDSFGGLFKAAREAENEFARARSRSAAAGKRFAAADAEMTEWLARARLVVMLAYGREWSASWIATGFTHRGTNVPKRIGPRIELSRRLAEFFIEQGEYEVAFAGVTARRALALQREIVDAQKRGAVGESGSGVEQARARCGRERAAA